MITQPDRPAGRGHKLAATPVKRTAEARGLRVFTPERLRPFADELRALGADAFAVASYGKIVPQAILDAAPIAFNVHPSLLPLYRGATPLQSAIRDSRDETGVTIIAMDAGMDTGDVLVQERTPIGERETYGELHDRLAQRGAQLVVEAIDRYAGGTLERKPQRDLARELGISEEEIARTLTRPLRKDDLVVDWTQPAKRIVDQIRALSPQPLARSAVSSGDVVKIVSAHSEPKEQPDTIDFVFTAKDGTLRLSDRKRGGRSVAAVDEGREWLVLDRVIPPGKPEMDSARFAQMMAAQNDVSARRKA